MGWSLPYTLGVLGRWKMASVYCQAVLCHDQRITLDGAPAEPVGAEAKDLAAKQLARLAARKAATQGRRARRGEATSCSSARKIKNRSVAPARPVGAPSTRGPLGSARRRKAVGARLSKPARAFMTAFGESYRRRGHHLPAVYDPTRNSA